MCNQSSSSYFDDQIHVRNGFAARCEAMALPRRNVVTRFGLSPWFGLCSFYVEPNLLNAAEVKDRTKGTARDERRAVMARQSHRLTSGGKAVLTGN